MIKHFKILLAFLLMGSFANAQSTDVARIEYVNIPFPKSKNSIRRYRALLQVPIPLDKKKNKFLIIGGDYRNLDLNIGDKVPFDAAQVGSLQRLDVYLGYVFKISENWRFGVKGGIRIASTFTHAAGGDDYIYTTGIYAINDMTHAGLAKPYRWILGLDYTTTPGRWYPLPLINYYREFRKNWTFTLGVPNTNVRHYLNDDHSDALQAILGLDNFFSNLQRPISIGGRNAENISMTIVLAGLGYEHYFTEHFLFYGYVMHGLYTDYRLRNNNRDKIYTINTKNPFYFKTGLRYKF